MKPLLFIVVLSSLAAISASAAQSSPSLSRPDLYVSPIGSDSWSGRYEKPNAGRTDGPFATIDRARIAVRLLKSYSRRTGTITVCLRSGTYYLKSPLVFTPEDSGPAVDRPVLYIAFHGEQPVVSGGVRLTGLHVNALHQWETRLADVATGRWVLLPNSFSNDTNAARAHVC